MSYVPLYDVFPPTAHVGPGIEQAPIGPLCPRHVVGPIQGDKELPSFCFFLFSIIIITGLNKYEDCMFAI